jgi:tripartite-type tricarboxylate transporter receptor subunit TctC
MRPIPTTLVRCFHASVAAVLVAATSVGAFAQTYPAKPIRLIVPAAPGSTADVESRFVAQELSKALGQPVVVENKAGAGGTIGTGELARAAPDGYTIGFASQGTLVFDQAIYAKPSYNSLKDFAPIALLGRAPNVMVVHPSNPASTTSDVIAVAKSKPGTLTFSSGGSGTSHPPVGRFVWSRHGTVSTRSVQERAAGRSRGNVQRSDDGLFQHPSCNRSDQGRQAQGAGSDEPGALAVVAKRADAR